MEKTMSYAVIFTYSFDDEVAVYLFETEEEAQEDAEMEIESRISDWEIDGVEYERELFEVIIEEV